jgi:hypothetical protein
MEGAYNIADQKNAKAFIVTKNNEDRTVVAMLYYDFGIDKEIIENLAKSLVKRLTEKEVPA